MNMMNLALCDSEFFDSSCQIEARPGLTALISPRFMGPGGQPGQPGPVPGMMRPMSVPRRGIESGAFDKKNMQFISVYNSL